MDNEEFYNRCAEMLGVEHDYLPFEYRYRTRWNNRKPGSGRFPDRGIIRKFGSQIHVALTHPVNHHGIYNSEEEVLAFLRGLDING